MEAGALKGRQILYYESIKSEAHESSSMTWRSIDEKLDFGSPDSHRSPERYDLLGNERGRPNSPNRVQGRGAGQIGTSNLESPG